MKTFTTLLLSLAAASIGWSQGTVPCLHFANSCAFQTQDPTGGNRLVYDVGSALDPVNGAKLSGTQYVAELYAGTDANSLVPITAFICRFRSTTSNGKGTWSSTTISGQNNCVTLPGFLPGSVVFLQVKVWDSTEFPTYEQALGKGKTGASKPFTYAIPSTPSSPDACMEGLQAFSLVSGSSPVRLASPRMMPDGFGFNVTNAVSGTTNYIQCSSNLTDWVTLATITAASNTIPFVDPGATSASWRFYRVHQGASPP